MAHRSLADEIIDLQVAQVRVENAIPEEQLLAGGYNMPKVPDTEASKPVAGIRFSQRYRDGLGPKGAGHYVRAYQDLCIKLAKEGFRVEVIFDQFVDKVDMAALEQLWTIQETDDRIEVRRIKN